MCEGGGGPSLKPFEGTFKGRLKVEAAAMRCIIRWAAMVIPRYRVGIGGKTRGPAECGARRRRGAMTRESFPTTQSLEPNGIKSSKGHDKLRNTAEQLTQQQL